jgi:Tfp pilus assembly protein PilX
MIDRTQGFRITRKTKGTVSRRPLQSRERGIALFITLLLLSLVSLLGLAMVLSVNSDMLINGYYGNYRGSFYAADSGLSIARQSLLNTMSATVSSTPCVGWGTGAATGCTSDPLSSFNGTTVVSSLKTTYGSFTGVSSNGSWPGSFEIIDNGTSCTNTLAQATGSPTTTVTSGLITTYVYTFNYTLCSTGRAQSLQQVLVKETGSYVMTVAAQTSTSQTVQASFASFGVFIDQFAACQGQLVPGTITGPAFTNGAWNWGTTGSYIYTDPVGQSNSKASYWFGSTCKQSATNSYSYGGQTVKPTFQQGLNLGQPAVSLPPNDFSQKWAVMDGVGCGEGGTACGTSTPPNPTNSDLNSHLKNIGQTSYPTTGASSGVYLPYCNSGASCTSPYTVNGGGIYVEGSAAVTLSPGTDGSGHLTQIYTIKQGTTTTTITTNITANTTTVVSGSNTLNLAGVPENLSSGSSSPATMLYVDGTVTGLTGPGQGKAGIQDYSQITVAAAGDIDITGDLIYAHEPITLNTSDALVSGGDFNQVLGIFTAGGNINLSSPYSNNNLETDASLAAINSNSSWCSSNSKCGFATPSDTINTWTIVGGRIESYAHSVSISQGNTYFDRRFTSKAGFAPPWFPSTTLPEVDIQNAMAPLVTPSQPQRLSWVAYPQ